MSRRRKLPGYENENKMMKIGKNKKENGVNITLNDGKMEEIETYRYLGVDISRDGGVGERVNYI